MERVEHWCGRIAIDHPVLALICSLVFLVACISGVSHIRFDADPKIYFSKDHEHFSAFNQMEETYGSADQVTIVLKIKQGTLYSRKHLALIETITQQAWTLPYATRVESLSNYNYSWSKGDELFVEPLIENALNLSNSRLQHIKQVATTDPDVVGRLASGQSEMALIRVTATLPMKNRQAEEEEMTRATHEIIEAHEAANPEIDILLTGNVISNTVVTGVAKQDVMTVIPMMYVAIFVMLGLLLRSLTAVFIIFVVTILSSMAALGLASWMGVVLNMMSVTSINIIITVAIAHCVHILVCFFQHYHQGMEKSKAISESLRINLVAITLTSMTTAIGFLSMNLSKMPPAHAMGNITAMGVGVAFVLSLFLLPLMLKFLPVKQRQYSSGGRLDNAMDKLGELVVGRYKHLLVIALMVSIGMLLLAPLNVMNDRFTENIKLPNQFRKDNNEIDKYFGGFYTIEYDFHAKTAGGISDPVYLKAMDNFVQWLRTQPEVRNVYAYSDLMKRLNRNMHGDKPEYYVIPANREEAAQYQLLYEMSQPLGSDMSNTIRQDKGATRLVVSIPSTDTNELIAFQQHASAWVKSNMPAYMFYSGESLAVMWAYLGQEGLVDGLKGALLALVLISIILMLVFKSFKYGVISLIPNLLPAGVGYGVWAIINGELNMGQMLVLSITIGIVVDDTVHFITKYLRARRYESRSAEAAIRFSFRQVGPALWITTAVLVIGFGMLMGSEFIPNSNLGVLTMCILIAALLLDFFLLPPLLILVDKNTQAESDQQEPEFTMVLENQ